MLICKLCDQLGNQMFAYAAIKSISIDNGYGFRILRETDNRFLKNNVDKKFGCNVIDVFDVAKSEIIDYVPPNYSTFYEKMTFESESYFNNYALKVHDNTVMKGHYLCPKYFIHHIEEVRQWFKFPIEIYDESQRILFELRKKYAKEKKFCSVHFRNGLDYRIKGFLLSKDYWFDAAKEILKKMRILYLLCYTIK